MEHNLRETEKLTAAIPREGTSASGASPAGGAPGDAPAADTGLEAIIVPEKQTFGDEVWTVPMVHRQMCLCVVLPTRGQHTCVSVRGGPHPRSWRSLSQRRPKREGRVDCHSPLPHPKARGPRLRRAACITPYRPAGRSQQPCSELSSTTLQVRHQLTKNKLKSKLGCFLAFWQLSAQLLARSGGAVADQRSSPQAQNEQLREMARRLESSLVETVPISPQPSRSVLPWKLP